MIIIWPTERNQSLEIATNNETYEIGSIDGEVLVTYDNSWKQSGYMPQSFNSVELTLVSPSCTSSASWKEVISQMFPLTSTSIGIFLRIDLLNPLENMSHIESEAKKFILEIFQDLAPIFKEIKMSELRPEGIESLPILLSKRTEEKNLSMASVKALWGASSRLDYLILNRYKDLSKFTLQNQSGFSDCVSIYSVARASSSQILITDTLAVVSRLNNIKVDRKYENELHFVPSLNDNKIEIRPVKPFSPKADYTYLRGDDATLEFKALTESTGGFHHRFRIGIVGAPKGKICSIVLIQQVPESVYLDLDELQHLGLVIDPLSHPIDLERPSFLSKQHTVVMRLNITGTSSEELIEYPFHLRYHEPSLKGRSFAKLNVTSPFIVYRCGVESLGNPVFLLYPEEERAEQPKLLQSFQEQWKRNPTPMLEQEFRVPVGHFEHLILVQWVTFCLTLTGAIVIIFTVLRRPKSK